MLNPGVGSERGDRTEESSPRRTGKEVTSIPLPISTPLHWVILRVGRIVDVIQQ